MVNDNQPCSKTADKSSAPAAESTSVHCTSLVFTADLARQVLASAQEPIAIALPEGVESIAPECFKDSCIVRIMLPSTLVSIGREAFDGCTSLEAVTFAPGTRLREIGSDAFNMCTHLERIELPDTVQYLRKHCFCGSGLVEITLPGSVRRVERKAFAQCWKLTNVTISEGVESVEEGCFWQSGVVSVQVPKSLKRIAENAFRECYALERVAVPADAALEEVKKCAFAKTGIKELAIPGSVAVIREEAFSACRKLSKLTFEANSRLHTLSESSFADCSGLCEVIFSSDYQLERFRAAMLLSQLKRVTFQEGLENI